MPCNLPDYVERGGDQVWRPPYRATKVTLLGLVIPADQTAIDKVLQRDLVAPTGHEVDYRSAHPNIVVICADISSMASTDKTDAQRGFMTEREVSIWCLAADKTAGERLVWYLPYLFADTGRPVAGGREVYGYPKAIGDFDAGYAGVFTDKGASTTIKSMGLKTFTPQTCAEPLPVVTVTRAAGAGTPPSSLTAFTDELTANLLPGGLQVNVTIPSGPGPSASATITATTSPPPAAPQPIGPHLKGMLTSMSATWLLNAPDKLIADMVKDPALVFLKQFRDATCPTKACYQAIIEASLSIDPLTASYAALDPQLFTVELDEWPSHPMASDLGLKPNTALTPTRAFEATLTYDVLTGLEVWKA